MDIMESVGEERDPRPCINSYIMLEGIIDMLLLCIIFVINPENSAGYYFYL